MPRLKRNPLPSLATVLFDAFSNPLDPSHSFILPDDLNDTAKYQRMCHDISNNLIERFGLQEKWYFESTSRNYWNNDENKSSHSICNLAGELPIEDSNIAKALYDKGHEVIQFRVVGCYCDQFDVLPVRPLPRPYVHVSPLPSQPDIEDKGLNEYENVIDSFIPQDWDETFKTYMIKSLSYSIASVTPVTYYFEFDNNPKMSTTDERTSKALYRAGYKVTNYYIVPCKEEEQ